MLIMDAVFAAFGTYIWNQCGVDGEFATPAARLRAVI